MSIGEFAARCGLSAKMLRTYAAAGLLVPAAVDEISGYRYYSPTQVDRAETIGLLRRARISLADIALFLKDPSTERVMVWHRQLDKEIESRRHALDLVRNHLATRPRRTATHPVVETERHTTTMNSLTAAMATDKGLHRDTNQDAVLIDDLLYAVADGMGASGAIASRMSLEALRAGFAADPSPAGLAEACRQANQRIWDEASTVAEYEGMGSTLTAFAALPVDQGGPVVANIGDSRLYRLRDGLLEQLTEDHSVVGPLVRAGELTEDLARTHPQRHLLTRALGIGPDVTPDVVAVDCKPGDRLVVSTDGLYNDVAESDIADASAAPDPESAVARLIDLAGAAGGTDNIAVIVIDVR